MFAFELGREFKLSIAEIFAIFPKGNIVFCDTKILILDNVSKDEILEKSKKIGGTIKIVEVKEVFGEIEDILKENINFQNFEGKFNYAINVFGQLKKLQDILKISKKVIKEAGFNPRFINMDFKNISSVAIIKEALIKKQSDFNFIFGETKIYFGNTIFVQDIYGYSNRDFGKNRDMNVGMLPPKLAQIMINIGGGKTVYDPFVGLGTVLIESINMGNKKVFGSDNNQKMVQVSIQNLEKIKPGFNFKKSIILQNAKYIGEINFLSEVDTIITEGYLGEIMTKNNISIERIQKQKIKLIDLYKGFFSGLQKLNFRGKIIICFPFWKISGKYFYFDEIYDLLNKYCTINKLLPKDIGFNETKTKSLLYKRNSQLVGREIFSLEFGQKIDSKN